MTNPKTEPTPTAKTAKATKTASRPGELQTAYELHTLAHMIHGHLCTTYPWLTPYSTSTAFPPPAVWPPTAAGDPTSLWSVPGSLPW